MAVCENATGQYYKVLLENSYIKDGFLFVTIRRYLNKQERDKEKERQERIENFLSVATDAYSSKLDEILSYQENNPDFLTDEIALKELEQMISYAEEFERAIYIVENFSVVTQNTVVATIPETVEKEFTSLGYEKEFISDPVIIIDTITINCGKYPELTISLEELYAKLKDRMSSEITNV